MTQLLKLNEVINKYRLPNDPYVKVFDLIIETALPVLNMANGPWLAGGAVRRLLDNSNKAGDFDLFFKDNLSLENAKTHLVSKFPILSENQFNITFEIPISSNNVIKVQLVKFYFETANDVLDWFDFTICQCLTDNREVLLGDFTLFDIGAKRLMVNNIHHATSSIRRLVKYSNQGYKFCDGTISEILNRVADNPSIIEPNIRYID